MSFVSQPKYTIEASFVIVWVLFMFGIYKTFSSLSKSLEHKEKVWGTTNQRMVSSCTFHFMNYIDSSSTLFGMCRTIYLCLFIVFSSFTATANTKYCHSRGKPSSLIYTVNAVGVVVVCCCCCCCYTHCVFHHVKVENVNGNIRASYRSRRKIGERHCLIYYFPKVL